MMTTLKITFQFGYLHQQENESLTNPILLLLGGFLGSNTPCDSQYYTIWNMKD